VAPARHLPIPFPARPGGIMNTPARSRCALAALALVALAAGCTTRPDVRHDHDPAADFKAYKTFAFADSAGSNAYTSLLDARLRQATRLEMEQLDYVFSERNPDLRVHLLVQVAERQELRAAPGGRGLYGYRGWSGGIDTVDYRQGTLRIDLVDVRRHALVWKGVAEGRLPSEAVKSPGTAIDAVVHEVFAGFPGGTQQLQAAVEGSRP
jgi:Domain of unknown function (DUF4136)